MVFIHNSEFLEVHIFYGRMAFVFTFSAIESEKLYFLYVAYRYLNFQSLLRSIVCCLHLKEWNFSCLLVKIGLLVYLPTTKWK